ncbi:MAG TPA: hypothetical protein DCE44_01160 [Verrucomicrobiales bacterium]|nr:hypothetical protein [Verrucomicrobiales bacterium]
MTYQRFEDLPVWQTAARLYETTEQLLDDSRFSVSRGYRDQLDRAALSVSNNIAEGFERGTTNELLQFIYIARGSAGEVRSMLAVKERRVPDNLRSQISDLKSTAESCSRQLRAWAEALQNSPIRGTRHLTERTRQEADRKKRADAFDREGMKLLPADHPLRRAAEARNRDLRSDI